jgi:2'-5' RNA ligase
MTAADAVRYRAGQTGLIVTVPEAEPVVARWRRRLDPAAAAGAPAHVTVLAPFLDRPLLDDDVIGELGSLVRRHDAFTVRLARCRRFPGVLYLEPVPDAGLRALTGAIARRWPEAPPYGGQFADVVPHMTIACSQDEDLLGQIETQVRSRLPVTAAISSVRLLACSGQRWTELRSFPLAGAYREDDGGVCG